MADSLPVPIRSAERRRPRVIHAPVDVANLAAISAYGLREVGADARSIATANPFRYQQAPDAVIPAGRVARAMRLGAALARCDVLHLYGGESMFPGRLNVADAGLMRRLGRKVVVEFFGSDIRVPSVEQARNPYYFPEDLDEEQARSRARRWGELCAGHTIVGDHSADIYLKPYFEHIHVVGQRVDTRRYRPHPPSSKSRVPVIVHAPSLPWLKGTDVLRSVLDEMHRDGATFEYVEIQGMVHPDALTQYARADLIVDQLRVGSHGQFAVEAMSLAKPVVCYIQPELVPLYPADLPLINANPDTLRAVLEDWLERPRDRHELGLAGRVYAERQHDVRVVARRLLEAYERLPRRRPTRSSASSIR